MLNSLLIFSALAKENVPQAKESLAMVDKMIADQAKAPAATWHAPDQLHLLLALLKYVQPA
jgi:hypothetical protein